MVNGASEILSQLPFIDNRNKPTSNQSVKGTMADALTPEETAELETIRQADRQESLAEEVKPDVVPETKPDEIKDEIKPEVKAEIKEAKPVKTVPHEAFHEERERRKEAQRELQALQEKWARADERIQILLNSKKEETPPDPNEDPLGYQSWKTGKIEKELESEKGRLTEQSKKLEQQVEDLRLRTQIDSMERNFQSKNPDYDEALQFLVKIQSETLEDLEVDEVERQAQVRQGLSSVVQQALAKGKNPAEAVYKMAQRLGFKKTEPTPTARMEDIEKGVKASSSLGSAGGKSIAPLTAEALADMSEEDFNKLNYGDFKKAMGG